MAETKYSIHEGSPKIYVHVPDGKSVTVDDSTEGTVKVTIPKGTYMKAAGNFGFNYCAFVQIEVTKSNGEKKFIPELDIDAVESHTKNMITKSGDNEFAYFKSSKLANYVFLFRVGTPSEKEADWDWTDFPTLTENRTKTFNIGSDVESYTVYFCGITVNTATWTNNFSSDSLRYSNYTWANAERNTDTDVWDNGKRIPGGGGNACPCDIYKDTVDSEALLTKNFVVGPLGNDIRTYLKWDVTQQKYVTELVTNNSLTQDMGTPTVATDNANNTFSAIIRPFKPGKNNPINKIFGILEFRKDNNPIGEFCEVPKGMSFRPQVWGRAYLNAAATSGYFMTEDVTIDTPYRCIGVYEAAKENGKTIYKELTTLHDQNNELTSSNTKIYYRRVTQNSTVKRFYFESHPGTVYTTTHFNIKPWWEDSNKNTSSKNKASDLTISNWPLTVAPINITTYDNGEKVNKTILAGSSAIWIDMFACATEFDTSAETSGLITVGGKHYISVYNYENKNFYTGKNFSPEYFHTGYNYKLVNGEMEVQATLPPYVVPASVLASATPENPHPSFLADTLKTESGNTCSIIKLDATDNYKKNHYYIAIRSLMGGGDVRKSFWLNTGYTSYPRAPRELWYESTHNNKIYISDKYAPRELPDKTYIYKEDLRPRLKDPFTWKWDQAFGDIYTPTEPSHYRVFLYLKSKEPRTGSLTLITNPNYDGYYTYLINATKGLSSKKLVKKEVDSEAIGLKNIGKKIPCYEMQSKYFTLNLKELGFKSGDYCGCRIVSFIDRWSRQIYSDSVGTDSAFYTNLTSEPGNYEITHAEGFADPFIKTAFSYNNNANIIENKDKSLYGDGGYSSQRDTDGNPIYSPNKSFAEGGCPSIDKYDYIESLTDCEVRNGAIVWVKISDTGKSDDWVEGTPWVKTENGWKEADSLHVKTENSATGWKESD